MAKSITDNAVFQAAMFACGFITIGLASAICGIVQAVLYFVQGDYGDAAISAVGGLVGSAASAALRTVVKSVVKGAKEAAAAATTARRAAAIAAKS